MNAAGVSVVICCYNSQDRLPETLRREALRQWSNTFLALAESWCTEWYSGGGGADQGLEWHPAIAMPAE